MEEGEKIAEEQAGFRSGYSTTDHIFTLLSVVPKSLSQEKGEVYVAFIDYQKALDLVNRESVYVCLRTKGLSRKVLNTIRRMYETVLCSVKARCNYTDFFECLIGIKQVCLLSPDLFSLFINVVAEEVMVEEEEWIVSENCWWERGTVRHTERFSSDWHCRCSDWSLET